MRLALPEIEDQLHSPAEDTTSRRVALGTGAAAALGVLVGAPLVGRLFRLGSAFASPSKAQDVKILQLVLQVEHTQVAFYEQALRDAGLTGELRNFGQTALGHERQHLAAIQKALGSSAGPAPTFSFGPRTKSADAFVNATIELEDLAVAGYNGQAANLTKSTLAAAAEIVSVEARHAAWIRALAGKVAAPDAVDQPITAQQVAQGLHEIGMRT